MSKARLAFAVSLFVLHHSAVARAQPSEGRAVALGANVDLFPTVASAINGKLGYAPQIWLGIEPVRLRLVGAHLEPPDGLAFADKGFHHPTTTVFAAIFDCTFGPHFDGAWVGSGFEIWQQSIEHDGFAETARWSSIVFTVGGGYIWRFAGNFFLDPWAAAHLTMNPVTVAIGPYSYKPPAVVADASLKIGAFIDL